MKKYEITCTDDGGFFLNGKDITIEWHNFFAGLHMEQEKDCKKIFIRRYARTLLNTVPTA